jgi:hypothetical protein
VQVGVGFPVNSGFLPLVEEILLGSQHPATHRPPDNALFAFIPLFCSMNIY